MGSEAKRSPRTWYGEVGTRRKTGQAIAKILYKVSTTRAKILDARARENEDEFEQVVHSIAVVTGARSLLMVTAQS